MSHEGPGQDPVRDHRKGPAGTASRTARRLRQGLGVLVALALALAGLVAGSQAAQAAPTPSASPTVHIWATQVNVRHGGSACVGYPSVGNCPTVGAQLGAGNRTALCQRAGATNTDSGYTSNYWTWIALGSGSGFVSNVYITGAAHLAGVPDCQSGYPATVSVWATSVNVRAGGGSTCVNDPSVSHCPTVETVVNPSTITALCQQSGATNTDSGYTSSYWTWVACRASPATSPTSTSPAPPTWPACPTATRPPR